jgi:putative membrane-bound dehydrogenase-like protein
MMTRPTPLLVAVLLGVLPTTLAADGARDVPEVPPGFVATLFAREPLVRQPCSMAFDQKGRLFVGMGPQFRMPKPDTPGDSVVIVLDADGDGVADKTKVFATGFNCIQGLAWRGHDLWVANAPDLTIVRDLDADDEADEYVRVYTDLGNLEHGLHGLNWAPDGKLYMSKGNSKGLNRPGRVAPKAFRDLMGVQAPPGSPDFPPPVSYRTGQYRHAYHDPQDDWGREGGILRCDDGGHNLEIVSRGFRNPWDITPDSGFNWLGTDNDQVGGDRVFMPFFHAHFGWNHPWNSHWADSPHPPTAPVSGPLFEGSGTGIIYYDAPQFPPSYRKVFFINDWGRRTTFLWRPTWEGALMRPAGGDWEPFARRGQALYGPTDIEVGPDGALWVLGWGGGYGANFDSKTGELQSEGRVFRIAWKESPLLTWNFSRRARPPAKWSVEELIEDFAGPLPVWRIDAHEELVRRGGNVKDELIAALRAGKLAEAQETWAAWTLGRIAPGDGTIADFFSGTLAPESNASLNLRIQAVRILAHRVRGFGRVESLPGRVASLLISSEPRLRFEAVQAIVQARQKQSVPDLLKLLAGETDRVTFYAAWQALRTLTNSEDVKKLLNDPRGGVRRGALLALLEELAIKKAEVTPFARDRDAGVREVVELVQGKPARANPPRVQKYPVRTPGASLVKSITTRSSGSYQMVPGGLHPDAKPYTDRDYTLKAVPPTLEGVDFIQTANDDDGSRGDDWLTFDAILPVRVHVALDARQNRPPAWLRDGFRRDDLQIKADHWTFQLYTRDFPAGPVQLGGNTDGGQPGGKGNYIVIVDPLPLPAPPVPTTIDQALDTLPKGDAARGAVLFHHRSGAGCVNCHRLGKHGNVLAPDLSSVGNRAPARHIVESLLNPSAVITEGFKLQLVETRTGTIHTGILLEETGLTLTLGVASGERLVLDKDTIETRSSSDVSAMPSYAALLRPEHVADITAYLLEQKALDSASTKKKDLPEPPRTP